MRNRILTLILLIALVVPAAGWAKADELDPNGAWLVAKAGGDLAPELDGRSGTRSLVVSAETSPQVATPAAELSGRSLFQQLLSWLEARLLGF